ncbi:hypothetical protein DY000_02037685 [Brassica cretica]|uniref:CASP-like protein n=1 Tax=Brassica cretica TaxID=69181 RepID=A0ABQ7BBJ0_BRACR|nr:hypothetical protein DY000_02037685 [Brassica cretica]
MPRISSLYSGSSRWCVVTSVAKFVAAFHAFYAAACSGSSSLCVSFDFDGFISLSSTLAVYLTSMVALLYLNNFSMVGV